MRFVFMISFVSVLSHHQKHFCLHMYLFDNSSRVKDWFTISRSACILNNYGILSWQIADIQNQHIRLIFNLLADTTLHIYRKLSLEWPHYVTYQVVSNVSLSSRLNANSSIYKKAHPNTTLSKKTQTSWEISRAKLKVNRC